MTAGIDPADLVDLPNGGREHRLAATFRLITEHLPVYGPGVFTPQIVTACRCGVQRPLDGYGGWWAWHVAHALDDAGQPTPRAGTPGGCPVTAGTRAALTAASRLDAAARAAWGRGGDDRTAKLWDLLPEEIRADWRTAVRAALGELKSDRAVDWHAEFMRANDDVIMLIAERDSARRERDEAQRKLAALRGDVETTETDEWAVFCGDPEVCEDLVEVFDEQARAEELAQRVIDAHIARRVVSSIESGWVVGPRCSSCGSVLDGEICCEGRRTEIAAGEALVADTRGGAR